MECAPAPAQEREAEMTAEEHQPVKCFEHPELVAEEALPISPSCSSSTDSTACSDLSETEEDIPLAEERWTQEALAADAEAETASDEALDALLGEPGKASHRRQRSRNGMSLNAFLSMSEKESRRPVAPVEVHDFAEDVASSSSSSTVDSRSGTPCSSMRHVHFNMDAITVHEICPYSEVYGIHPRTFDFDKHFWMVPAKGWPYTNAAAQCGTIEEDEYQSDSSDGEWEEWDPKDRTRDMCADGLEVE